MVNLANTLCNGNVNEDVIINNRPLWDVSQENARRWQANKFHKKTFALRIVAKNFPLDIA